MHHSQEAFITVVGPNHEAKNLDEKNRYILVAKLEAVKPLMEEATFKVNWAPPRHSDKR